MAISNNSTGLRPGVCTSTTRPTAPYEGQMIYETDTDMVAIWNGTAWRYISATTPTNGTVLQTVYASHSTVITTTSTTPANTGLAATITPKSTSSKILVLQNTNFLVSGNSGYAGVRVVKTIGGTTTTVISNQYGTGVGSTVPDTTGLDSQFALDSPSTTSSITYTVQFWRQDGSGTLYAQYNGNPSTIVLMEIAG